MFTVEYYALEALLLIYIERIFLSPFPQNKYHYVFTLRKKKKSQRYIPSLQTELLRFLMVLREVNSNNFYSNNFPVQ